MGEVRYGHHGFPCAINRHYTRSAGTKGRQFHTIAVSDQDFEAIRTAVRHALHLN